MNKVNWPLTALSVSLLQALVVASLEASILFLMQDFITSSLSETEAGSTYFIHVYFALFILALVFQALCSFDAYLFKNTMQVVGVAIFNAVTVIYSIVQVSQIRKLEDCYQSVVSIISQGDAVSDISRQIYALQASDCPFHIASRNGINVSDFSYFPTVSNDDTFANLPVKITNALPVFHVIYPITITIIVLMVLFNLVNFYLSYKVYGEYGWHIYQSQGASIQKREIMRRYHLGILLLKFNIYFSVSIVAQVVTAIYFAQKKNRTEGDDGTSPTPTTYVLVPGIIVMVAAVCYYILGFIGLKKANKTMMILFLTIMSLNLVAVIVVLVLATQDSQFAITRIWLTAFVIVQILLNLLTLYVGFRCMSDFKRGFKEVVKTMFATSVKGRVSSLPPRRVELD